MRPSCTRRVNTPMQFFLQFIQSPTETTRSHPLSVATVGAASGLVAWFITWADYLIKGFQLIGGFCGCLLSVVAVIFMIPRLARFYLRWRKKGFLVADREDGPLP